MLKLGTGDPSAYVLYYSLFIPNHFHYLLSQRDKKQSKERITFNITSCTIMSYKSRGSDLWANFIVPPPPEMCNHIYKFSMQNENVLIVVHHPFSFAVFLKVWLTDSGSPLHILTIGCHCFKQTQTPAPHSKQETYSTAGIKK